MRRQRQKRIRQSVEVYTASWIEIQLYLQLHQQKMVEAYTASWIEMVEKADVESPNTSRAYIVPLIEYFFCKDKVQIENKNIKKC